MLFRPEEVDRRSERIKGLAPVVTALPEPDHHALRLQAYPVGCYGELQGIAAVMTGRRYLDGFSDHRREAERVGCTTGMSLASA